MVGNEMEMKAFIFSRARDAKAFHQDHYFSHYDEEKDPRVVKTCNPREINYLRRYATEIPNPDKK